MISHFSRDHRLTAGLLECTVHGDMPRCVLSDSRCWVRSLDCVGERTLELETEIPSLSPSMSPSLLCGFGPVVSSLSFSFLVYNIGR